MKTVLVILALLGVAHAISLSDVTSNMLEKVKGRFSEWRAKSPAEKRAFALNLLSECKWNLNADEVTSNLDARGQTPEEVGSHKNGINCMSAFSRMKFMETFLKAKVPASADGADRPVETVSRRKRQTVAASVDWRQKGYVTAVQNQGQCGSCWTFSAAGAMEGAIYKKTGVLQNFSEQNLVDCVRGYPSGSDGCNGGWMTDAYNYTKINTGLDKESAYPYKGVQSTCAYVSSANGGYVTSWTYTKQNDEADLKTKLASVGPMAVAVDASYWQDYVSGVFTCNSTTYKAVNHGVVLVGYGTDATAGDYYIIKNSWGTGWGEQGYIRVARNKGVTAACGIPAYANYPIA